MPRSTLYEDFLAFAKKHALFPRGERVLVAVSGGPDSVALFDILRRFSARGRIHLFACHLDHRLRGADSTADAAFVKSLCDKYRVPLALARKNISALAAKKRMSIESAARAARYDFFLKSARAFKCAAVATAHTLSDNAETILQRLIEGAGPDGLSGIPLSRPLDSKCAICVVRPILFASRAEIIAYVERRRLDFRTDATNLAPLYTRNRIRLGILPALKLLNPSVESAIVRAGNSIAGLLEIVESEISRAFDTAVTVNAPGDVTVSVSALRGLGLSVVREVVRRAALVAGVSGRELTAAHVESLTALISSPKRSAIVMLSSRVHASLENDTVHLAHVKGANVRPGGRSPSAACQPLSAMAGHFALSVPGRVRLPGIGEFSAEMPSDFDLASFLRDKTPDEETVDAAAVAGKLTLRFPRRGERFAPLGAPGAKKVSDVLIDAKVPAASRSRLPVVADAKGIVWLVGLRIADRVKITNKTKRFLHLSFQRLR